MNFEKLNQYIAEQTGESIIFDLEDLKADEKFTVSTIADYFEHYKITSDVVIDKLKANLILTTFEKTFLNEKYVDCRIKLAKNSCILYSFNLVFVTKSKELKNFDFFIGRIDLDGNLNITSTYFK